MFYPKHLERTENHFTTYLVLLVEDNLAVEEETRLHALLEQDDIVWVQTEVVVLLEKHFSLVFCMLTGHDVPSG